MATEFDAVIHPKFFILVYEDDNHSIGKAVSIEDDWFDTIQNADENRAVDFFFSSDAAVRIDSNATEKEYLKRIHRPSQRVSPDGIIRCDHKLETDRMLQGIVKNKAKRTKGWKGPTSFTFYDEAFSAGLYEPGVSRERHGFFIVVEDVDTRQYSIEGPMIIDDDWTDAVLDAWSKGRRVITQILHPFIRYDYHRCKIASEAEFLGFARASPGTIIRTPTFELEYPYY